MSNQEFSVLSPEPPLRETSAVAGSALETLEGKTIGFLWDYVFKGDQMWAIVKEELGRKYSGVTFVGHEVFGNTHGNDESDVVAGLAASLRDKGVDAVVSGVGA